jgi:hypothetical protein
VALANIRDGYRSYSKPFSQNGDGKVTPPNFVRIGDGEFGSAHPIFGANVVRTATLRNHVARIVESGSKKQVMWIATAPVVASMANHQVARICGIGEAPSNAMSEKISTLHADAPVAADHVSSELMAIAIHTDARSQTLAHFLQANRPEDGIYSRGRSQ